MEQTNPLYGEAELTKLLYDEEVLEIRILKIFCNYASILLKCSSHNI